jgi:hypothetical protein
VRPNANQKTAPSLVSFKGEHFLIPGFLSKFILVLFRQYHCPTTAYFAPLELTPGFLSRCDAEVEAQQSHQYMIRHVSLVTQYLGDNLEQDIRVTFVTL